MINVVNKYKHESTTHDFYIGRGSSLGNPYSSKPSSKDYVIQVETRDVAIKKYEKWLREELKKGNKEIVKEIIEILKHENKHGKVFLVCFCKPKPCHGDVLKDIILEIKEKSDLV